MAMFHPSMLSIIYLYHCMTCFSDVPTEIRQKIIALSMAYTTPLDSLLEKAHIASQYPCASLHRHSSVCLGQIPHTQLQWSIFMTAVSLILTSRVLRNDSFVVLRTMRRELARLYSILDVLVLSDFYDDLNHVNRKKGDHSKWRSFIMIMNELKSTIDEIDVMTAPNDVVGTIIRRLR